MINGSCKYSIIKCNYHCIIGLLRKIHECKSRESRILDIAYTLHKYQVLVSVILHFTRSSFLNDKLGNTCNIYN